MSVSTGGSSGPRDVDGPKNFAAIFYPIVFVFIFSSIGILGCFCASKRFVKPDSGKSLFSPLNSGPRRPRRGLEERLMG